MPGAQDKTGHVEVRRNDTAGRFEITVDGALAGICVFRDEAGVRTFPHTVVESEFEGRGLAGTLVQHALEATRADGLQVDPLCSYVDRYLSRHPEFEDLRA